MMNEFWKQVGQPLLLTALTALAGWLGMQLRALADRWVGERTKQSVIRTCVQAAEQLYHELDGAERLAKAGEAVRGMLAAKGLEISEQELRMGIEAVIAEMNYGFTGAKR